jgi:uncharacterized membrane protein (UPF0127 family)
MVVSLICKSQTIQNVFIADTFLTRFKGYMFDKEPRHKAILIKPCNSIHTFFMNFNIDVLFLNENMEVVKKIEGLKPRKLIMPVKEASLALEGKEGEFKEIEVGNRIYFEDLNT